jgi:predicted ribosome quality control (RQC) complex YloA/Tae2 family protein
MPERDELFEQQKKQALKIIEKKIKKAEKRVEERQQILGNAKNWSKVHHEGLLLKANLFRIKKGMKEIAVSDWEQDGAERTVALDPLVHPKDQVVVYFRRSKKLRLGIPHAERMLLAAQQELDECLVLKHSLEKAVDTETLTPFLQISPVQPKPQPEKKKPAKPYLVFTTKAGIEIWVGKSAKDNDKLTFHYANGLDWWMHANNHPGSHVVIRCAKELPDDESLKDAAELALRYSKAKQCREEEVCLAKVNALTPVKGIPGKVMVSRPKILRVVLNDDRWQRLIKKVTDK